MQFKPDSIRKIVCGQKTQTRRLVKPGERLDFDKDNRAGVLTASGRLKWKVGRDYAVQPGRGKPGLWWHPVQRTIYERPDEYFIGAGELEPLRLRVLGIRREDVREISLADAIDEGFETRSRFWEVWCGFYDPVGITQYFEAGLNHGLMLRSAERYRAWALSFEVVMP